MRKIIVLLSILSINFGLVAQVNIQLGQQAAFGGSNAEDVGQLMKVSDGGYILSGYSTSGVSGNKTTGNYGEYDGWIIKLNPSLSKEWEVNVGGDSYDSRAVVAEGDSGSFYVAMPSLSNVSGNKTSSLIGICDFWVVKLSSSGNILWQKSIGGAGYDAVYSITKTTGGFLLFGSSDSDISTHKTETSRGGSDYWFIKIDSNGNRIWDKTVGSSSAESLFKNPISMDTNGDFVAVGRTMGSISGEKTENNYGFFDIWATKLTADGQLLWEKSLGGNDVENLAVVLAEQSKTTIAVASTSDVSGNRNVPKKGNGDCWLVELDVNGNIVRQKAIGGEQADSPRHIFRDSFGNIVISMASNSSSNLDKTETNRGGMDIWLVSLDENWNILWQKTIGSTTDETPVETIETSSGQYLIIGEFATTVPSGDLNVVTYGNQDFLLLELRTNLSIKEIHQNPNFSVYPNPTNGIAHFRLNEGFPNGEYTLEILDMVGKVIHKENITKAETIYDFNGKASGAYTVRLMHHGKAVATYKIIVDRVY